MNTLKNEQQARVREFLRNHGPATLGQIQAGTGHSAKIVSRCLREMPDAWISALVYPKAIGRPTCVHSVTPDGSVAPANVPCGKQRQADGEPIGMFVAMRNKTRIIKAVEAACREESFDFDGVKHLSTDSEAVAAAGGITPRIQEILGVGRDAVFRWLTCLEYAGVLVRHKSKQGSHRWWPVGLMDQIKMGVAQ